MANSIFPIRIGAKNGSNGGVVRALKSSRIPHAFAAKFYWYQKFDITRAQVALEGDTSQEFDLHVHNPNNLFPANVMRRKPLLFTEELVAGGTIAAATATLGDTAATNCLQTATNIFTGATLGYQANTTGASQYADRFEAAFIPVSVVATTTGFVSAAGSGIVWYMIGFDPVPGVS
jgi:hypothetical protein